MVPAHPGSVRAKSPQGAALEQGRSTASGRRFNLAVLIDGELNPHGRRMGRALGESKFHHFAGCN
jgi:hypothetical protein